jgi:hypothetical protein
VIASLKSCERVWAVAAINGQIDRLRELHGVLEERFLPGDRLVYLGNYTGGDLVSAQALDELLLARRALLARFGLLDSDIVYLRGRQEEMWQKLLQLHLAQDPSTVLEWMLPQGVEFTLRAYGGNPDQGRMWCRDGAQSLARWTSSLQDSVRSKPGHAQFFASLKRAAVSQNPAILFVHAGIDTNRPLSAQTDSFWWGAEGYTDIAPNYEGFRRIVRGFDADSVGLSLEGYAITIDNGSGNDGSLEAICLASEAEVVDRISI